MLYDSVRYNCAWEDSNPREDYDEDMFRCDCCDNDYDCSYYNEHENKSYCDDCFEELQEELDAHNATKTI